MSPRDANDAPVHVVVLNWNGWRDTIRCVRSVTRSTHRNHHVVVVDNGSDDGSVRRIRSACPEVTIVEAPTNLGFAGGSNLGIRAALQSEADFVWLLNNDTVVGPEALRKMVEEIRKREDVGIVGSVLVSPREGTVEAWGGGTWNRYLGTTRRYTRPGRDQPTYIAGTSMLIRRTVFETVGLLDEDFFFYLEDVDFCLRALNRGWRVTVAPQAVVLHKGGATVNEGRAERSDLADRHHARSSGVFIGKHGRWVFLAAPIRLAGMVGRRVGRGESRRALRTASLFLHGVRVGLRERRPLGKTGSQPLDLLNEDRRVLAEARPAHE
ncbi:MAG TPA: glycosyltransferase family 2 protein [Actinomycetota bacterium]|nr:glycosyltransferase family 2 protein [Actinomycetota bacterium]